MQNKCLTTILFTALYFSESALCHLKTHCTNKKFISYDDWSCDVSFNEVKQNVHVVCEDRINNVIKDNLRCTQNYYNYVQCTNLIDNDLYFAPYILTFEMIKDSTTSDLVMLEIWHQQANVRTLLQCS